MDFFKRKNKEPNTREERLIYPENNPNPVLRLSEDLSILYENESAKELLDEKDCPDILKDTAKSVLSDGKPRKVEISFSDKIFVFDILSVAGGVNIYGFDITKSKKRDRELRRLASFPQLNPRPEIELDLSGKITYANQAAHDYFPNLTKLGEKHPALDGAQELVNDQKPLFERGIEVHGNYFHEFIHYLPHLDCIRIYMLDLTRRRAAEDALRESERRYKTLVKHAPVGIYEIDLKSRRLMDVNEVVCNSTGYSREELLSMDAFDLLAPSDKKIFSDRLEKMMAGQEVSDSVEYRIKTKRGEYIWALINVNFKYDGVIPATARVIATDISDRKKSEEALKESEERLKIAQESAGAGVWDWDIPNNKITWSDELYKLFGLDPKVATASFEIWQEIIYPEDREIADKRIQDSIENQTSLSSEYRIVLPSGQIRWIVALGKTSYGEFGKPLRMSGICIDITRRKEAEISLKAAEKDLRNAQSVSQTGSWRLNIKENKLTWSDENHKIFGIQKGVPLTYETFLSKVHPEDREFVDQNWKSALKGAPYDIDHRIIVNGKEKWVRETVNLEFNEKGELLGGFGTTQDITQYKKIIHQLEQSEKRYKAIVESHGDPVCRFTPDTTLTFVSKSYKKYFGESEKELLGKSFMSHLPESEKEIVFKTIASLTKNRPTAVFEHKVIDGKGRERWLQVLQHGIFEDGKLTEVQSVDRDITELVKLREELRKRVDNRTDALISEIRERKEIEADLLRAYSDLKAMQKMREDFINSAAHALKTPLTSIGSFADMMYRERLGNLTSEQKVGLETIIADIRRLKSFVSSMLDASRVDSGGFVLHPQNVNISELAENVIESLKPIAVNKENKLKLIAPSFAHATADRFLIEKVLDNLINNALNFTDGGIVEVRVKKIGGNIKVEVMDTGRGIQKSSHGEIFNKFYQAEEQTTRGTGLGLYVSKKIVDMHGGEIGFESKVGKGSTFWFTLPKKGKKLRVS